MNQQLKKIHDAIQQNQQLSRQEKEALLKSVKDADKQFTITEFKLDRTEKVKRTTAILLEETIEELEQKRKTVEAQNRELEIEASLERVRSIALSMKEPADMLEVCSVIATELDKLGVKEIRNVQTAIFYESKGTYMNYEYYLKHNKTLITETSYTNHKMHRAFAEQMLKGKGEFFSTHMSEAELPNWVAYQKTTNVFIDTYLEKASSLNYYWDSLGPIALGISTYLPLIEKEIDLFKRFRNVFELAYRRYLDIEKALAQATEAMIEAALERVRSRSMAMHKSDEVMDVAVTVYDELQKLDFKFGAATIIIMDEKTGNMEHWLAGFIQKNHVESYQVNNSEHPLHAAQLAGWREGAKFVSIEMSGSALKSYAKEMFTQSGYRNLPDEEKAMLSAQEHAVFNLAYMSHGALMWAPSALSDENAIILQRFAKVFEQTYTRFLDLQKAEAQAREAQIEAALERIRSSAMAMHSSEGILEVTHVLREQVALLGEKELESILVHIYHEDKDQFQAWYSYRHPDSSKVEIVNGKQILDWSKTERARKDKEKYHEKESDYTIVADRKMLKEWYEYLYKLAPEVVELNDKGEILVPDVLYYNYSKISAGALLLITNSEPSQESKYLLKRAAQVFNLAYSRFLDLQKAEAQARDSQIEASLERVRSKAMAMQKSEDLANAVAIVFEEMDKLNLGMLRCGIGIINKGNRSVNVWAATKSDKDMPVQVSGDESMDIHPLLQGAFNAWLKQEEYSYVLQGEDLTDYYKTQVSANFKLPDSQSLVTGNDYVYQYYYLATFQAGGLFTFRETAFSEEAKVVMKRFADVFNLTYTRYNDLQLAEAQTREAKIEAAMERVRARAMAMQKPAELVEVAQLLRSEMGLLGVEELETSSIYIHDESSGTTECWYAIQDIREQDKKLVTDYMTINLHDTWVGREMLKFYTSGQKQTSILMQGENRKEWINYCAQHSEVLQGYYGEVIPERTYHLLKFSNGYMGAASPGDISAESWDLLKRATTVFSLAYTRFSDLQQAEASTKEAVKQAALDRIRAEIASMRTIDDLEKITPLIWNELTILGVAFIRCGVFIMDDANELIHTFLSTPEGKAIAAFHIPYTTPGNIEKILSHWRHKKNYTDHWDKAAFTEFAGTLIKEGALLSPEEYLETIPRGGFYLHFLPFLQGMLYVGNTTQLHGEEIKLIQSVADAFSTAYARYEDFNKLEAAKQQVDKTLVDLKQAQTQLVQSEKMASLGELTAGIAHEIQNPLNFVNNFSEVSKELLNEMKTELESGNTEDAKDLANDVIQNLEKINHHGKRADAIVKGMLQHSRMSSGQKELTDINVLADEYLRLSYHGLRAKDNTFNAAIKTDFDNTIEKINIVPQDIGRVILNLYNNAFYALAEKKHASTSSAEQSNGYKPTILVSTKNIVDKVEISVSDNGNGIPQNIVDKIFQPFFTTKPTGQGTGLGLSLSYDIIKAHGGEIKVESKEGEGATFIIQLQP